MFCSDDLHPDILIQGHIDRLVRRAVQMGFDLFNVLRVACSNPVEHFRLPVGQLREGDPADFIEVDDLREFRVLRTFIGGQLVADHGKALQTSSPGTALNRFVPVVQSVSDLQVAATSRRIRVMEAFDGELITQSLIETPRIENGLIVSDLQRDLLKIVVVNRYRTATPAIGFVRGFGLKRGAIASSVAHDSHNVVAVGVDDESLASAIAAIGRAGGGLAVAEGASSDLLPLPVAGLMSLEPFETVARAYIALDQKAKMLGSTLRAPFMTLSFMALLVIPELKLGDQGLFDCRLGALVPLFAAGEAE
jgi:adenine deaminase